MRRGAAERQLRHWLAPPAPPRRSQRGYFCRRPRPVRPRRCRSSDECCFTASLPPTDSCVVTDSSKSSSGPQAHACMPHSVRGRLAIARRRIANAEGSRCLVHTFYCIHHPGHSLQFEAQLPGRQIGILASAIQPHTKWGPAHRQQLRPQMSNRCISGLYHLEK